MGELIEKLGIDWRLLIANTITFFIVLWVLRKYAYGPIMAMLDKRQKTISDSVENAAKIQSELSAVRMEKDKVLKEAKAEAFTLIESAKSEAGEVKAKLMTEAEDEAGTLVVRTRQQLENERQQMMASARTELADLVVAATAKVVAETLDDKLQKKLAINALEEVKKVKS